MTSSLQTLMTNSDELLELNSLNLSIIDSIKGGKDISTDGISIEHISQANMCVIELILTNSNLI